MFNEAEGLSAWPFPAKTTQGGRMKTTALPIPQTSKQHLHHTTARNTPHFRSAHCTLRRRDPAPTHEASVTPTSGLCETHFTVRRASGTPGDGRNKGVGGTPRHTCRWVRKGPTRPQNSPQLGSSTFATSMGVGAGRSLSCFSRTVYNTKVGSGVETPF